MSTGNAVEVVGLTKAFGDIRALDGLDLRVTVGEVAGFVGPNGAGKSTTIRVLLGLLRKDSGVVTLLDKDPWHDAVALHRRLAYVPGEVALWPTLTGGETIDFLGRLHGGLDLRKRDELIERFEFDPRKKVATYSKGNRQKVALIAALATDAELLILDEPTSGLDPLMEAVFTECIMEAKAAGTTVLLSSHILAEVEKLADTITIIRAGRSVESGTLDEMRHLTRTHIEVMTDTAPLAALSGLPGVYDLKVTGNRALCSVDAAQLDTVIKTLSALGIKSLSSTPPSLEDLFLSHYADELSATAAEPIRTEPALEKRNPPAGVSK
ncbi:MAG: ABC transporter ATP-binding protein [Propionibacteriaceae bacterium]|jgi:ABC-2 type transport system ATP-binding protein|nr:ABC transporter ATP-binding protein [Propionibacteriaceae bacterium]